MISRDLFDSTHATPHADHAGSAVSVTCSGGSYFNTTSLTGDALGEAVSAAQHQDAVVLAIYRAAGVPLSPSEVWHRCQAAGRNWPLTSVRRAITGLANAGALARLETKRVGEYGRPEHEWGLAA